jgi:O-acetyl-ADP-ribose deacetylase (regulator of RNase III)
MFYKKFHIILIMLVQLGAKVYRLLNGDLLDLAESGEFDCIVHGCNCFNTMGAGIARQIKERFPDAYNADQITTAGDKLKLGAYSVGRGNDDFMIVNAYTQYGFKATDDVFEYAAFQRILDTLLVDFAEDTRFGFPLIGCGLAGGDEKRILSMIAEFSKHRDTTVVVFKPNFLNHE